MDFPVDVLTRVGEIREDISTWDKYRFDGSNWVLIPDTVEVADDSITEAKPADWSVTETKLADNSVSTNKIQDEAVTPAKIAAE